MKTYLTTYPPTHPSIFIPLSPTWSTGTTRSFTFIPPHAFREWCLRIITLLVMNNQIPGRYSVQLSYSVHETNMNFTNSTNNLGGIVCYFMTLYLDYRALNGRINEWCIGKGLEGRGNTILAFGWRK